MLRLATAGFVLLACTLTLSAQGGAGPDVIVGSVYEIQPWGTFNGITAFSIGTESCNIGTSNLTWDANSNLHPAITGNMYRLKDGRFEQIGMSWVKHGFYALSNTLCGSCPSGSPTGFYLGVGCSDPYSAQLNGTQGLLGPRSEINPVTGYFPYPVAGTYPSPQLTIGERLQVLNTDLTPASNVGALYFVQGHYVHQEDAAAGNKSNNASYRRITLTPNGASFNASVVIAEPTHQQQPGIQAWQDNDSTVQIKAIDIPNDGRIFVGYKATQLANGLFHYEYAVQNLDSDRAIGSFSVGIWPGATLTNVGFHAVPSHSGEPYGNVAWTTSTVAGTVVPGSLTWSTTPYGQDPNANAMRWGSLFNFRFDSNQLPGDVTLGMFKPGFPATMNVPTFCAPKRPPPGPAVPYTINSQAAYDYVNISASGTFGPYGDDVAMTVPLPFAFPFYGQAQNQIVISTNGYLTLAGQDGTASGNVSLPSPALPTGMIAGYWDDLYMPSAGSVRYQYTGGRFVVYWNGFHLSNQSLPLQFETILEPSGSIVSTIVNCPGSPFSGATATRGLESYNGTTGLTYSHNTPNSALSNSTIRYEVGSLVPPTSNLFYSGSLGGGLFRIVYVSGSTNSPIMTMASLGQGPVNLGALGLIPVDFPTTIGVSDYFGLLTGFPNPAAVTDVPCSQNTLQFWVNPGVVPSGVTVYMVAVDWPNFPNQPPQSVLNGSFNISNPQQIQAP